MLLPVEKIIFLNNVAIFKSLRAEDLHLVASITKEEFYKNNELIIQEGEMGDKMFIIVDGKVEVFKVFANNDKVLLNTMHKNEFFGDMAIFDEEPRSASIKSITDAHMLTITKEDLKELVLSYPDLSFGIFKGLCSRVREANTRLIDIKKQIKDND